MKFDEHAREVHRTNEVTTVDASFLIKKAAIFSTEAFKTLKYCSILDDDDESITPSKSTKHPKIDPCIFGMSPYHEELDGLVKWSKDSTCDEWKDEYDFLFYEKAGEGMDDVSSSNGSDDESDQDDICGVGNFSQDYY